MPPTNSLADIFDRLPETIREPLIVLSSAKVLSDEVATQLIEQTVDLSLDIDLLFDVLHSVDFVIERNSEWHIRDSEREFLLQLLYKDPHKLKECNSVLLGIANNAHPSNAGTTVPTYLTSKAGIAYHTAVLDSKEALIHYADAYTGHNTGEQWLLGELAGEQQRFGIISASAIEPYFLRGMTAYRENRINDADQLLRRVCKSNEIRIEVAIALHIVGLIRIRQYHLKEAERLLRRSLEIGERLGNLHHQSMVMHSLGNLIGKQEPEEAERLLRRSLEMREQLGDLSGQSMVMHSLGNLLKAIDLFRSGEQFAFSLRLNQETGNTDGYIKVSRTIYQTITELKRSNESDSALDFINGCLSIFPNSLELEIHKVNVLLDLQKYPDALVSINEVINRNPESSVAYNTRANIYKSMGKDTYSEAQRDYRYAIEFGSELKPRSRSMFRHNLAKLLSEISGNQDEIVALWEESIQIDPKFVWSYAGLGEFYFKFVNDMDSALNYLNQGLNIAKKHGIPDAIKHINDLLLLIGNVVDPE